VRGASLVSMARPPRYHGEGRKDARARRANISQIRRSLSPVVWIRQVAQNGVKVPKGGFSSFWVQRPPRAQRPAKMVVRTGAGHISTRDTQHGADVDAEIDREHHLDRQNLVKSARPPASAGGIGGGGESCDRSSTGLRADHGQRSRQPTGIPRHS